jgi:hypothetical protein
VPASQAQELAEPAACSAPVRVLGQGLSCRTRDLWKVSVGYADSVLTHGPDGAAWFIANAPEVTERAVPCVPATAPHQMLVYAHPLDKLDRSATLAPRLRQVARQANQVLYSEAAALSSSVDIPFVCDTTGQPQVADVVLPLLSGAADFSTILADLKLLGYNDTQAKYWVFYDDNVGGFAGQGTVFDDDRASSDNHNNAGPSYAVSYGIADWGIALHEAAHTWGAVQDSAPHSSGAFHCNDGLDVMCYADGGPRSALNNGVCTTLTFDCNLDDYFDPRPDTGSYLSLHWNLASPLNVFLQTINTGSPLPGGKPKPPTPLPTTTTTTTTTTLPPTQLGSSQSTQPRQVTIRQVNARGTRLACGTMRRPCHLAARTTWRIASLATRTRAGEDVRVVLRKLRGRRWAFVLRSGATFRIRRDGSANFTLRVAHMPKGRWSAQAVLSGQPARYSAKTFLVVR